MKAPHAQITEFIGINVETLLLVAVWQDPCVFQGCFRVRELQGERVVLFFFRCEASHLQQMDILSGDFLPDQYQLTHLYHELGLFALQDLTQVQEDALYVLKYALYTTLKEMLQHNRSHFVSIDPVVMQAMMEKVQPLLTKELALSDEDPLGFAVAMDFCPREKVALSAALTLLEQAF